MRELPVRLVCYARIRDLDGLGAIAHWNRVRQVCYRVGIQGEVQQGGSLTRKDFKQGAELYLCKGLGGLSMECQNNTALGVCERIAPPKLGQSELLLLKPIQHKDRDITMPLCGR